MSRSPFADAEKKPSGLEHRAHARVDTPFIVVRIDGETYRTVNWSMGGMLIDGYGGRLTAGALFSVDAIGNDEKSLLSVHIRARVVRCEADKVQPNKRHLAITYLDLDDSAYTLLGDVLRARDDAGETGRGALAQTG
ncbi:PilZ domain-containing protein [Varunaivibrio sulfuroxidans]|uniref:PilZ domain-containing protein n=1 Tax=Varunaivibrio sulfuroxidans TaxID=1773489 RepID=A0A4R3JE08_9PROT|nr:PilZ domain-containing protein [Varunaivibrio sulfuroxidans]TCS64092.1 PilZ domain-containing protein [Varunaivibrio sulfuroxidans]WES31459.1 PilZ domain-containing protein [Varunaivibrio sulfuroxidans]